MLAAVEGKWISAENLLGLVRNTVPFLDLVEGEFVDILKRAAGLNWESLTGGEWLYEYFALCLASHHATVATFVPTDVDSKIRGLTWRETRDPEVLQRMLTLAIRAMGWDQSGISRRVVQGVSGHNGEQLSVLAGAHGRCLDAGFTAGAEESAAAIEGELRREGAVFAAALEQRDGELDVLRLAMTLAHNRGDLNQGISFWRKSPAHQASQTRFTELARYDLALRLYQQTGMSAEGHRNYPLRSVKGLRKSAAYLLPLSPFLDEWGGTVIHIDQPAEVVEALVLGCRKLEGQQGYYRALAGMAERYPKLLDDAVRQLPNAVRKDYLGTEMRKLTAVPRVSFESMMRKRARAALLAAGHRNG